MLRGKTGQVPPKYSTSIVRLIEMMGLKNRENFLENYLNPSMETGLVESLYPDKPKHPRQKYRLTDRGKKLLTQ